MVVECDILSDGHGNTPSDSRRGWKHIVTIVAVVKYRSLQRQQYFFIPSLAVTDMLLGIGVAINIPQVIFILEFLC